MSPAPTVSVETRTMLLLEGNIGAGKTSLGKHLQASGRFHFLEEPVDRWRHGFASNIFELFYHDMQRWSFTFQIMAFVTRAKTWSEILAQIQAERVILERSIYSDRHVFARNLYETGAMTDAEWELYTQLWDFLALNYAEEPDRIIYLRTPAAECRERIRSRGRSEEQDIPLDYLMRLEELHDAWLLDHPRAIVLDGTRRWSTEDLDEALTRSMQTVTSQVQ